MPRFAPALTLALLLTTLAAAADDDPQSSIPALTSSPVNDYWDIEGRRDDELVFVRAVGHEPIFELNSHAFRGREVTVDIKTDSNLIIIQNRAGEIELKLQPADRYRLVLDGDADKPKIKLGSRELKLENPAWKRIITDERTDSFRVFLRGATEANIKLNVRRGDIPLRKPAPEQDEKK